MKKILIVLMTLLLCFLLVGAEAEDIIKPVKYSTPAGRITYMNLLYAKPYKDHFIIYVDMYNADSVIVSNHNYFLDTRAPFQLSSQKELNTLLDWYQYYK